MEVRVGPDLLLSGQGIRGVGTQRKAADISAAKREKDKKQKEKLGVARGVGALRGATPTTVLRIGAGIFLLTWTEVPV